MNSSITIGKFLWILLAFTLVMQCCKKDPLEWNPEVQLVVEPDSGLTTVTFDFQVDITNLPDRQKEFYVRWDLDNDGNWDGHFSATQVISHRFYAKGVHPVTVDILTEDGKRLSMNRSITVNQGFSPPHPDFSIEPEVGNFQTLFTFDASTSFDDEDSLSTLQFRWDFQNDGSWDTKLTSNPFTTYTFAKAGQYNIKLGVIDPTQRTNTLIKTVEINKNEPLIFVDFTWSPEEAPVKDTFLFDASACFHQTDPNRVLTYTWKTGNDLTFGPFSEPQFSHSFISKGVQKVTLTVTDQFGLFNQCTKEVYVLAENKPPNPSILTSTAYGNISTQFYISAWNSRDDVTPPSLLKIRWDFEGDGIWDTGWSEEKELFYQYAEPGEYWLTMEAEDEGGERGSVKKRLLVSNHVCQTSYIRDVRNGKFYGTVKIGDHWWMSDNLDFRPDPKMSIIMMQKCYEQSQQMCDTYGALYQPERNQWYQEAEKNICPEGWRVPSKEDWDSFIGNIPASQGKEYLEVGGQLGLNAILSGYGKYNFEYSYIYDPPVVTDTIYHFFEVGHEVRFMTNTVRPTIHAIGHYYYGIQYNYDEINQGWGDLDGYYAVRCIKKD